MAMSKCKECSKSISTWARQCPNCGVNNPTTTSAQLAVGLIAFIAVVWFIATSGDDENEDSKKLSDAECMKTLSCWGEKHYFMGGANCKPIVERLAKYSHQWTDGALEPKFSHYRWKNPEAGIITVIGDKIQFQNGFGAYQNMTYECDYDPVKKEILDARVIEGYLN